jgi:hypothetical protein
MRRAIISIIPRGKTNKNRKGNKMKLGTVIEMEPETLVFNKQNRTVNSKHVARLKNAIAKRNLLHINPIKINSKREIIDGQHRVTAAIELQLKEVPCLVVNASVDEAVLLNQHAKNWSGMDFAHYWASQGKEDYLQFIKFVEDTHLRGSTALKILAKGESFHYGNFRAGTFRIGNVEKAYQFISYLEDFRDELPVTHTSASYLNRQFVFALASVIKRIPRYDHKKMLRGVSRRGLKHTSDQNNYIEQLKKCYGI